MAKLKCPTPHTPHATAKGVCLGKDTTLEVVKRQPIPIADLAKYHPLEDLARHGGGKLHAYGGNTNVGMNFNPKEEGFIWLTIGKEETLIHKDELLFVARFAKGSAAV
jgi:hypothetical protein